MKKLLLPLLFLLPLLSNAQNADKKLTKFEAFTADKGIIIKFIDTNLPSISAKFGYELPTKIRTFKSVAKNQNDFFLQIKGGTSAVAMIEYSDILETINALKQLRSEVDADVAAKPDYLENKYVTEDGFEVGYYIESGKATWYVTLDEHPNSTFNLKNIDSFADLLNTAKDKINELRIK